MSFFTISAGTPLGAMMPCQFVTAKFGRPDSIIVGTWGSATSRLSVVTASALNWPDLMKGSVDATVPNTSWTCPATASTSAGDVPR